MIVKNKNIPVKKAQETSAIMKSLESMDEQNKTNVIELNGEVLLDETLIDLQNQAGELQAGDNLVMKIASPGGSVEEGLKIMKWMNQLSEQGIQVITVVTANAYSIASLIMLSANIKLISKHGKVMVHNPMLPELSYVNANELEKYVSSLRALENEMYFLYKTFTGLDESQIRLLMDNETYLTPHEAVRNGFADMVVSIKKTPYQMASKPEKTVNMSKTMNVLNQVLAKLNGLDVVNQKYYDNAGGEIEIFQADGAQYQIGDRVSQEDGEFLISDGCKLIIEGGVIKDIIQEEVVQPEVEVEEVIPEVETVSQDGSTGELETPIAGEFNTGQAPMDTTVKSKDSMPSSVTETVESTVTTKETVAQAEPVAQVDEPMAQVDEPVAQVDEPMAQVDPMKEMVSMEQFKALEMKFTEMYRKMEANDQAMKAQAEKSGEFQATAVEAIDALASQTVSGFKPEARAKVEVMPTMGSNSIFQSLRRKAQLANKK